MLTVWPRWWAVGPVVKLLRLSSLWLWGGFIYYLIELCWRGYSHPSMFVVGGCCFVLNGGINNWLPWELGIVWQALTGAAAVTLVELGAGLVLNVWLGLGIWDYSNISFNFFGQICLTYSLAWIILSMVCILLDDYLRYMLYGEERPRYTVF